MSDIVSALADRSGVHLNVKKNYAEDVEVEETDSPLTARRALEAAKALSKGEEKGRKSPTMQLQIIVGRGEGKATREFEIILWPELFANTTHGKLTLRFFISKVLF